MCVRITVLMTAVDTCVLPRIETSSTRRPLRSARPGIRSMAAGAAGIVAGGACPNAAAEAITTTAARRIAAAGLADWATADGSQGATDEATRRGGEERGGVQAGTARLRRRLCRSKFK